MTLDPDGLDLVCAAKLQKPFPQLGVEGFFFFVPHPAVGLPFFCPAELKGVADILAV